MSQRWTTSRGNSGARYAALGAGGAALAAARRSHSTLRSGEWEPDNLSGGHGGSGFFVVGGRRVDSSSPLTSGAHNDEDDPFSDGAAAPGTNGANYMSDPSSAITHQNAPPSRGHGAAMAGMAGLGAGLAAAFGAGKRQKRRSSGKGKEADHSPLATSQAEADAADVDADAGNHPHLTSDDDQDDAERRGLMSWGDATAGDTTMGDAIEGGPSGWTREDDDPSKWGRYAAAGAGAAGIGAAAMAGMRHRRKSSEGLSPSTSANDELSSGVIESSAPTDHRDSAMTGDDYTSAASTSALEGATTASGQPLSGVGSQSGSGSGSATASGSGSGSGPNASSNSTGQRTSDNHSSSSPHTGSSLPPPPRAPRGERQMFTYGNLAPRAAEGTYEEKPARIPSFTGGFGDGDLGMVSNSLDQQKDADDAEHDHYARLTAAGLGGGAAAGLGAFAAYHRASRDPDERQNRDANQRDSVGGGGDSPSSSSEGKQHYSRFISRDTPLLGPEAETHQQPYTSAEQYTQVPSGSSTFGESTGRQHNRLPTIQSVGEFGERGSSTSNRDAGRGATVSSSQMGSASGNSGTTRSGAESFGSVPPPTHSSQGGNVYYVGGAAPFMSSSRNTLGAVTARESLDNQEYETDDRPHQSITERVAGAGLLGSLALGWRRLRGQDGDEYDHTHDTITEQAKEDQGTERQGAAHTLLASDSSLAAEVQSQRASVHNGDSTVGHGPGRTQSQRTSYRDQQSQNGSGSGSGSGGTSARSISANIPPEAVAEEDEGGAEDMRSPYADDGNDADDEDAIGSRQLTSSLANNTSGGTAGNISRHSASTGISRGTTSNTYTSSSAATRSESQSYSGTSSQRRGQQSSSGASTGAASYSPSHLGPYAASSISSRGGRSGQGSSSNSRRRNSETAGSSIVYGGHSTESEGQSSRATAGGYDDGRRASMDPTTLGSVLEGQEGPAGADIPPEQTYYPSESLGAAVRRQMERETLEDGDQAYSAAGSAPTTSVPSSATARAVPSSLMAGNRGNPAPAMPSLSSADSSQWRQSPRVESASHRAAQAAAQLDRRTRSGATSPPGPSSTATPPRWQDLRETLGSASPSSTPRRSRIREAEEGMSLHQDEENDEEEEQRRAIWPKFLRF